MASLNFVKFFEVFVSLIKATTNKAGCFEINFLYISPLSFATKSSKKLEEEEQT